jgi:hypothetical protein
MDGTPALNPLTDAEVYAMIDSLGDVGAALSDAREDSLANLYTGIDLQVRYESAVNTADVSIRMGRRVNSADVRGGLEPLPHAVALVEDLLLGNAR